ncbi:MAG TPA: YncE family protein [Candidatus Acidoferrales bacterium]|nr:YncE family protein [Candidatus Acidoferrales bacterium]
MKLKKKEGISMKRFWAGLTIAALTLACAKHTLGRADGSEPLRLVQSITIPGVPTYPYTDHLGIDLNGHRLFATMQGAKSVVVIDFSSGKVVQRIPQENPHGVFYRDDLKRIYVIDEDPTLPGVRVFDGNDYHPIKSIKLSARSDSAAYDPQKKLLYVVNGGEAAKLEYSYVSIVDTTSMEDIGDIKVEGGSLEQLVIDESSPLIYVAVEDKNEVAVIDREARSVVKTWPITKSKLPAAITLDEVHHRLFVGCRTADLHGHIIVFDTNTGKEIDALPIGGHVDQLSFDSAAQRIYASDGLAIDVYHEDDPNRYTLIGTADTALMSKTGLLAPEIHRYFAAVPQIGSQEAKILVFQVQ